MLIKEYFVLTIYESHTKKHFGQRVYYLQYLNCMLHSQYNLRSVFYRFEIYDHALPISLFCLKKMSLPKKNASPQVKKKPILDL